MPRLIPISGKKLLKILVKKNYEIVRISGSHHFLENKVENKSTTVPIHSNEDLGRGLLKQILNDLEISVDEFEKMRTE